MRLHLRTLYALRVIQKPSRQETRIEKRRTIPIKKFFDLYNATKQEMQWRQTRQGNAEYERSKMNSSIRYDILKEIISVRDLRANCRRRRKTARRSYYPGVKGRKNGIFNLRERFATPAISANRINTI